MDVVKQTIDLIIGPLTHIMNLSLSSGIVPEQMKVARVIPLFKSGILTLFTNYMPVSVLPAFSKFLERIVYKRLDSFLNIKKYKILSYNQYGFRKKSLNCLCFYFQIKIHVLGLECQRFVLLLLLLLCFCCCCAVFYLILNAWFIINFVIYIFLFCHGQCTF